MAKLLWSLYQTRFLHDVDTKYGLELPSATRKVITFTSHSRLEWLIAKGFYPAEHAVDSEVETSDVEDLDVEDPRPTKKARPTGQSLPTAKPSSKVLDREAPQAKNKAEDVEVRFGDPEELALDEIIISIESDEYVKLGPSLTGYKRRTGLELLAAPSVERERKGRLRC